MEGLRSSLAWDSFRRRYSHQEMDRPAAHATNGVSTPEVSRKLTTGSKFDVQFNDLNGQYAFGFAAFDNAQVRHAVHYEALQLRFAK